MSMRDDQTSLGDMLRHANEAVELLGDTGREALKDDRVLQLTLTRLVEIIGEAANRVTRENVENYPDIPWAQIMVCATV